MISGGPGRARLHTDDIIIVVNTFLLHHGAQKVFFPTGSRVTCQKLSILLTSGSNYKLCTRQVKEASVLTSFCSQHVNNLLPQVALIKYTSHLL